MTGAILRRKRQSLDKGWLRYNSGQAVLVDALERLGASDLPGADVAALEQWGQLAVLGHGEPVGRIRSLL